MKQLTWALILILTGCANGMNWQPEDDGWTKTGKTVARIPVAIATLGMSEAMLAHQARQEAQQRQYQVWFSSLSFEQQMQIMQMRPPAMLIGPPNFMLPPQPLQPYHSTTRNCIASGSSFTCY